MHLAAGYEWRAAGGQPARPVLWITGEMDEDAARRPEWADGGEATVTVLAPRGQALAHGHASLSKLARAFLLRFPDTPLPAGEYLVRLQILGRPGPSADASETTRVTIPPPSASAAMAVGQPLTFRRGPFTGPSYQPTADLRFRRAERLRVDLPVSDALGPPTVRLLDRRGQPLPILVQIGQRDEEGVRFATAEITLAPLAQGDYLVEVSIRRGDKEEKRLTAFRIVP